MRSRLGCLRLRQGIDQSRGLLRGLVECVNKAHCFDRVELAARADARAEIDAEWADLLDGFGDVRRIEPAGEKDWFVGASIRTRRC